MMTAATLENCLDEAFRRLAGAAADRRCPFHTPTLATVAPDGAPEARTLVLRGFEARARTIRLHTDARSAKVLSLAREPRCQLHLYDAGAKLQLRLSGSATLHGGDALAESAWRDSREPSRMCYAVEPGPGSPVGAPLSAPRDASAGWDNFRAILLCFDLLEWLELAAAGHRRARFDWRGRTDPLAQWLVP
jgi:pyridoxamine 5'-phosphate oxidase